MDYVNLGRSGLKVSRACLGAMNFGTAHQAPWCDEAEARRIIDAFLDAGHNFIDTANNYTGGQSEEVIGRAVAGRREAVVIATKARSAQGPGPNDQGLSRLHLTRALEASLTRLGLDHVDLYQMHAFDAGVPLEETMDTLAGFLRAGKVRYIGCSNFTGSQIVEAQWVAARVGGVPLISLQPRYSLISREIEADVQPTAQRHGLGALTYGVLAGGVLSGKYRRDETPAPDTRYGGSMGVRGAAHTADAARLALRERNLDIAEAVREVAVDLDAAPSAVAVAWCLARRGVTCVIIGPRTLEQLDDYLRGFELQLPQDVVKRLSDVSRPDGAGSAGGGPATAPAP
ncbi:MAG TPA: aldo/keto reductase [Caulobacteraceae bacterium]|nr:aldo/keto reductase [Caulobacteraceae bacterium]